MDRKRLFFLGFTLWKRTFVKPFFRGEDAPMIFLSSLRDLADFRLSGADKFFIWGRRVCKNALQDAIRAQNLEQKLPPFSPEIYFVEDGFVRSIALGSDLTRPFSLIVDGRGLYVDAAQVSDLEHILQETNFDPPLLERAGALIEKLKLYKISKYNAFKHEKIDIAAGAGQKIILLPAQVEDDVSILLGGGGLDTLGFIQKVREENPDAYLVFKPHPDVLSGNRRGLKDEGIILRYCDAVLKNCSIVSALELCDEVHTITSTAGFDALLRGKKVVVYGTPFYAGWGLTQDRASFARARRKLSLEALVAGVLILYPRYIHPKSKNLCEVELCLDTMTQMQNDYFSKFHVRFFLDLRNFLLRRARRVGEYFLESIVK